MLQRCIRKSAIFLSSRAWLERSYNPVRFSCLSEKSDSEQLIVELPSVNGSPFISKAFITQKLETAIVKKNAHLAWRALKKLKKMGEGIPEQSLLRSLLLLLSDGDAASLMHAQKLLSWVSKKGDHDTLDREVLGCLAMAYARNDMFDHSAGILRLMLQWHHYPPLSVWKPCMAHWIQKPAGVVYAIKVFLEICRVFSEAGVGQEYEIASMKPDIDAFHVVLVACVTLKDPTKAEEIIALMPSFGLVADNKCFCLLINMHANDGNAIIQMTDVLLRMKQSQRKPNVTTLNILLWAIIETGNIGAAEQVMLCWYKNASGTVHRENAHHCGKHQIEQSVVEWMKHLGAPCKESFTILLRAYLEKRSASDAAKFLRIVFHKSDSAHLSCGFAFDGLLRLEKLDGMHSILNELLAQDTPADSDAYAMLVKAFCKLYQPIKAEVILEDARKAGHLLDVTLYDEVLGLYVMKKDTDRAYLLFREMKRYGISPLELIFDKLLVLAERKSKPHLMRNFLFVALREPPLRLELHHWNRTILGYCKAKLTFDALRMIEKMKSCAYEPDANTYVFLLSGYILQGGKTNEILLLWKEIADRLSRKPGWAPLKITEELLNGFMSFFVKYGYFKLVMDVVTLMEECNFWIDKGKFKHLYLVMHKDLYTSKHRSQRRIDKSRERRAHVAAFKAWVGLPP